jgi:adenylate cyclase class 2
MRVGLEREIKLRFASIEDARAAVTAAGAALSTPRRLQRDVLLDTSPGALRNERSALRIRVENGRGLLTFKGPADLFSTMKLREELETPVSDPSALLRLLEDAGFHPYFRYEKFREEYTFGNSVVAIDETPVGVFVEIEGDEAGVTAAAAALGRSPADYLLDSYRGLFIQYCAEHGLPLTDMLFPE